MKITKGTAGKRLVSASKDNSGDQAKRYIKSAIDVLGKSASKGDQAARNAIADLSVILLSMK